MVLFVCIYIDLFREFGLSLFHNSNRKIENKMMCMKTVYIEEHRYNVIGITEMDVTFPSAGT